MEEAIRTFDLTTAETRQLREGGRLQRADGLVLELERATAGAAQAMQEEMVRAVEVPRTYHERIRARRSHPALRRGR